VPRTPWGRRRTADSPRPGGRRWAGRLRRGARRVLLVRVGRRRRSGSVVLPGGPDAQDGHSSRLIVAAEFDPRMIAPISPAVPGAPAAPSVPLLPGEPTAARRVRFLLVQACTVGSLMLGMSAIFLSMYGQARWAAACLVGCVVFDGLDGALARRLGVASPFGAQMDSLADMCSFGIAAPVMVFASIHGSAPGAVVAVACALLAIGAAIRLARFNVSPKDGRFFCGVPTTMVAAVLSLGILIGLRLPGPVAVGALAVLALAMVSSFPYAKVVRLATLPPWLWLPAAVGALLDYRVTFAALVAVYLLSGPAIWLRRRGATASGRSPYGHR
jgi:CDP-diacylglycerol--serine O-phosphatidyltransferase